MADRLSNKLSTFNSKGLCTSWIETEYSPVVSTVWHPLGCYQTAFFPKPFSEIIFGYKLTATPQEAQKMHALVVEELVNNGVLKCCGPDWNTSEEEAKKVIARSIKPDKPLNKIFNRDEYRDAMKKIGFSITNRNSNRQNNLIFIVILFLILLAIFVIVFH